jgi:hypothetical protein
MDPILLVLGYLWLKAKKSGPKPARGPSTEARSGRGHFAPSPSTPPSRGPSTETRSGRGHF